MAACCLLASLVGSVDDGRSTESVIVTLYLGSGVVRPGAMVIDREIDWGRRRCNRERMTEIERQIDGGQIEDMFLLLMLDRLARQRREDCWMGRIEQDGNCAVHVCVGICAT